MSFNTGFPRSILSVSRQELKSLELKIDFGQIPEDLRGHFFTIGPVGTIKSQKVGFDEFTVLPTSDGWTHAFNGDGMVYRIDFVNTKDDSSVKPSITSRIVKPPSFFAELLTETKDEYSEFKFITLNTNRLSTKLGFREQLNTALIPLPFPNKTCTRLLVTNDISRPYEIDPVSLKVLTPVGNLNEWKSLPTFPKVAPHIFRTVLSAAHPCFDHNTGELFSSNTVISGKSSLVGLPSIVTKKVFNYSKVFRRPFKFFVWLFLDLISIIINFFLTFLDRLRLLGNDELHLSRGVWEDDKWQLQNWQIYHNGNPVKIFQSVHMLGMTEKHLILVDGGTKVVPANAAPSVSPVVGRRLRDYCSSLTCNLKGQGREPKKDIRFVTVQHALEWMRDRLNRPQLPNVTAYVVSRDDLISDYSADLKDSRKIEVQKFNIEGSFYHFIADYLENDKGIINLHVAMNYATDPLEDINESDISALSRDLDNQVKEISGLITSGMDVHNLAVIQLDTKAGTSDRYELSCDQARNKVFYQGLYSYCDVGSKHNFHDLYWMTGGAWPEALTQFIYDMYANKEETYSNKCGFSAELMRDKISEGVPVRLVRLHIDQNKLNSRVSDGALDIAEDFTFPHNYFANSPIFIPSSNCNSESQTDGYIVCNVIYDLLQQDAVSDGEIIRGKSEFWIFNARVGKLSKGPICKLSHPDLNLGLTIHTAWLPQLTAVSIDYDVQKDFENYLEQAKEFYSDDSRMNLLNLFKDIYSEFSIYKKT